MKDRFPSATLKRMMGRRRYLEEFLLEPVRMRRELLELKAEEQKWKEQKVVGIVTSREPFKPSEEAAE